MCQFNLIIIKTPAAAAYLEKLGYYSAYLLQYGYSAWCWGREQFCNCGSMVGCYYPECREKGKYPEALGYNDYKRASAERAALFRQRAAAVEAVQKRQLADGFKEEAKRFPSEEKDYSRCLSDLFLHYKEPSSAEIAGQEPELSDTEKTVLGEAYGEYDQNEIVRRAAFLTPPELVEKMLSEFRSQQIYSREMKEFRYYRRIFFRLLKLEACIYFTHIWNEPGELKLVNTLPLNKLRVSDLTLLAQDDVIRIRQKEE